MEMEMRDLSENGASQLGCWAHKESYWESDTQSERERENEDEDEGMGERDRE